MSVLVTGGTGYLGSYALVELLARTQAPIALLIRAKDDAAATEKLWQALQLHLDAAAFREALPRFRFLRGDLHAENLGLDAPTVGSLCREVDSVLHIAASLNRKSEKACLNTNLRGTLSVIELTRRIAEKKGLRRFTSVSTVAVAGERSHEVVHEDEAIDWQRSDYDPYARTKKFAEHMVDTLLAGISKITVRPSIVVGDSRHGRTNQFDMARATFALADLPVVPLPRTARADFVNADFVGRAMVKLHLAVKPTWEKYHLSSGSQAPTVGAISDALRAAEGRRPQRFLPALDRPFELTFRAMNRLPRSAAQQAGAVMKVFWPYITFDTVFANQRVITDTGDQPANFAEYGPAVQAFCKTNRYRYPYLPLEGA